MSASKLLFRCGLLVCLMGCGGTQAYSGPARAPQEVAKLVACGDCQVTELDGQAPPESALAEWEILPGEHTLRVLSANAVAHQDGLPVAFSAKAGQVYRIDFYRIGQAHELDTLHGPTVLSTGSVVVVEGDESSTTCYFTWGRIVGGVRTVAPGVAPPDISTCP